MLPVDPGGARGGGDLVRRSSARDVVEHAVLSVLRTPGRALAFGAAAFVAAALLTLGLTDAASRQADVTGTFDALSAQTVQVTLPLRGSPYTTLTAEQIDAIRQVDGVTGVAWGSSRPTLVRTTTGAVTSLRSWTVDGDLDVLELETSGHDGPLTKTTLAGGASPVVGPDTRRFDHVVVGGRSTMLGGVITGSPVIGALLDAVVSTGDGTPPTLSAEGEIVVRVSSGWAPVVAPRLATLLAPGNETSVLVRYPPDAAGLRSGVLGSVDSLVYVASAAILVLGAGAVMVGTFFRVLSERRLLGLYRAIGGSASFVVLTITVEAAIVGTVGSLLGTTVGLGVAATRSLVDGTVLVVPWLLVGGGVVIGLVTNALGAVIPALRTVRESPLSAIRSR